MRNPHRSGGSVPALQNLTLRVSAPFTIALSIYSIRRNTEILFRRARPNTSSRPGCTGACAAGRKPAESSIQQEKTRYGLTPFRLTRLGKIITGSDKKQTHQCWGWPGRSENIPFEPELDNSSVGKRRKPASSRFTDLGRFPAETAFFLPPPQPATFNATPTEMPVGIGSNRLFRQPASMMEQ